MKTAAQPIEKQKTLAKAKKLEWITLIYLASVAALMYAVMGSSQAMKTAWVEDVLSMLPGIVFLVAAKINSKEPNHRFPYGYHHSFSIAFLAASVALFSIGCLLLFDSAKTLIKGDHPGIGSILIFGKQIWLGWLMLFVLAYSSIPAVIIGRIKIPLAIQLHNKVLYTDADTQKADYMTAFAAMLGIIGVGLGYWWTDSVAAILISTSVIKDGFENLKTAVLDLMDRRPVHTQNHKEDELLLQIEAAIKSRHWVTDARIRFREHGEVYFGEIAVLPKDEIVSVHELEEAAKDLKQIDPKIYDVGISPVSVLPDWE